MNNQGRSRAKAEAPSNPNTSRIYAMPGSRQRLLVALLLAGTVAYGVNSMFGQLFRSGWVDQVTHIMSSSDPNVAVLPGSETPILTHYTGWYHLDQLMALANIMFANITDGSRPQLSLYAIQFAGQLVPIFAVMMVEGLRVGNTHNVFFYTMLWAYLMQATGYATIMPIYCIMHLYISAASTNNRDALLPRSLRLLDLQAIVPAFGIGYYGLTCLYAYPFSSWVVNQWTCSLWQGFPHYVVGFQHLFAMLIRRPSKSCSRNVNREYYALSGVYDFTFNAAAAAQLFTYAAIIAVKVMPSQFPHALVRSMTFGEVFVPDSFHGSLPVESMARTMHSFFLYDQWVGSTAMLIWALFLFTNSRTKTMKWKDWMNLVATILGWAFIAGPAGAIVRLLQRRDKAVLCDNNIKESRMSR